MSYGGAAYGARAYAAGAAAAPGPAALAGAATASATAAGAALVGERAAVALTLDTRPQGTVSIPLLLDVGAAGTVSLPLPLAVGNAAILTADSLWRPVVRIAGIEVTAQVQGAIRVDIEEGRARVATLALAHTGSLGYATYSGQAVDVGYGARGAGGSALYETRLFTGRIESWSVDVDTHAVTLVCGDGLSQRMGLLDRAAIEAALPGSRWSPFAFDANSDSAEYARDRLATLAASLDADAYGNLRLTPWARKTTPDWTFSSGIDGSVTVEPARRDAVKNQVEIRAEYRYPRFRQVWWRPRWEIGPGAWENPLTALQNLYLNQLRTAWGPSVIDEKSGRRTYAAQAGFNIPTRAMILQAAKNTGWQVESETWVPPPPTGIYEIGGANPMPWECSPAVQQVLCFACELTLSKRLVQSVTERHTVLVRSSMSVARLGLLPETLTAGAVASNVEAQAWASDPKRAPLVTEAAPYADQTGDLPATRAAWDDTLLTLQAVGRTRLLAAHRQTRVACELPLHALVDVAHTARIQHPRVDATGKVRRVTHTMDLERGRAVTRVELAISAVGATGAQTDDALAAPSVPAAAAIPATPGTLLGTTWGGVSAGDPVTVPASFTGLVSSVTDTPATGSPQYEHEFRLQPPDIAAALADPLMLVGSAGGTFHAVWTRQVQNLAVTPQQPEVIDVGTPGGDRLVSFVMPHDAGLTRVEVSVPVGAASNPAAQVSVDLSMSTGRPVRLVFPRLSPVVVEVAIPDDPFSSTL